MRNFKHVVGLKSNHRDFSRQFQPPIFFQPPFFLQTNWAELRGKTTICLERLRDFAWRQSIVIILYTRKILSLPEIPLCRKTHAEIQCSPNFFSFFLLNSLFLKNKSYGLNQLSNTASYMSCLPQQPSLVKNFAVAWYQKTPNVAHARRKFPFFLLISLFLKNKSYGLNQLPNTASYM